ncbi:hypothetical protein HAX54_032500 [Datura stramonium]|uniref:Uncharacterized protein n=1 Tax=Datura stramonium TaxID=4076 RepID=A0ABS8VDD0_DATST|nr:hypothetical protein [Datura stramonium]
MGEVIDAGATSSGVDHPSTTQSDGADEITVQLTNDLSELKVAETSVDESNTEGQHSLSVEEVDAILTSAFYKHYIIQSRRKTRSSLEVYFGQVTCYLAGLQE